MSFWHSAWEGGAGLRLGFRTTAFSSSEFLDTCYWGFDAREFYTLPCKQLVRPRTPITSFTTQHPGIVRISRDSKSNGLFTEFCPICT